MAKAPKKIDNLAKSDGPKQPTRRRSKRRAVKRRVKKHYDARMPSRRRYRIIIWVAFLVCAVVIAAQLLYPPDRALPFTQVAGKSVGNYSHEQLAKLLGKHFRETKLKLVVDKDTSIELPVAGFGAEPNTEVMIESITRYPFWQRFLPLSFLGHTHNVEVADIYYTDSVLRAAIADQAAELSSDPVNARLAIENGKLVATSEKQGRKVAVEALYEAVAHAKVGLGRVTQITVEFELVEPAETSDSLRAVQSAAEAALARQVLVVAGEHTFEADRQMIASWLQLSAGKGGETILAVSEDELGKFFDTIDSRAGMAAGQTNVTISDGHETARTAGRVGRAIGRANLGADIAAWLLNGEGSGDFVASFYDIAPSVLYNRKYTSSEKGLQAYLTDASRRMDVRIGVRQLNGNRWAASVRANDSIPSASTYKLFVAKWLFDEIDKGNIKWGDKMLDTTVSVCFDRMIVASTNPCAEAWLAKAGRQKFNQYLYGLGFSRGTNFAHPMATHSTVNDLQRMMIGVYDGTLVGGAHRDRLLRSLNSHPFPYGIPAGSAGKVHDKVGFLWDYVHDTAIVHHPKGSYVMTIMTKGQSYAAIASLTREIEKIMYP